MPTVTPTSCWFRELRRKNLVSDNELHRAYQYFPAIFYSRECARTPLLVPKGTARVQLAGQHETQLPAHVSARLPRWLHHPIEIAGEGDIRSSSGQHDCLLEEQPCEAVAVGA